MKRTIISSVFWAGILLFTSCDKGDNTVDKGGKVESRFKALELTPFGELNGGASAINSHAGEWRNSVLRKNYRSYCEVGPDVIGTDYPTYARMIKLADGTYILMNQNRADKSGNGSDVYWATSPDMKNWTGKGVLFKRYVIKNSLGNTDGRWYTNGNGKVLKNGDVLLFASYRACNSYSKYDCRYDHGIEMIRSSDNGKTWSEPYEIHHGPNWEAMILELNSGELQCYFSESRPHISSSHSGTSMVNSVDGGRTWLPSVNDTDPYRVIRHRWYSKVQDKMLFTDQMANLIQLNGSNQIAGVFESCAVYDETGKHFKIAFAWSPENGEWDYLQGVEGDGSGFNVAAAPVGPADRALDLWPGAGPDLKQFPSGETLVSYTTASKIYARMGDSKAREWKDTPFQLLPAPGGGWGSTMTDNSHEVAAVMRNTTNSKNITVSMVKWALNHRIAASTHQVDVDGDNDDWSKEDEALFVGSKCQAQTTLRCSSDANNVYFLVECLDEYVSKDDYIQLYATATNQSTLNSKAICVKVSPGGLINQRYYAGGWVERDLGVKAQVSYDATLSNPSDTDNGWLTEIAVPRSSLDIVDGRLLVNLAQFEAGMGEDAIIATENKDTGKWMPVSGL